MTVGRNDPCPCGSGKKFKKCCAAKGETATAGLTAAIRMKGGVSFDRAANAYRVIVHSWDNAECLREPREWHSAETFASEDAAMAFYKARIRPGLEGLMAGASRIMKPSINGCRRRREARSVIGYGFNPAPQARSSAWLILIARIGELTAVAEQVRIPA
jgi:hypothetical protein